MPNVRRRLNRAFRLLLCVPIAAGVSGANCTGLTFVLPLPGGGAIQFNTVTVELWNTTAFPVEPRLFVDPEDDSLDVDADENRVRVAPPVGPGEVVTLTLACGSTGAIETDHAVLILPGEDVESDNDPIVRRHDDFNCGDTVTFIFMDEPGDDFHTRVEVNGRFVED